MVFLGENHDNSGHHRVQADWIDALKPSALVFEMLTTEQALRVTDDIRNDPDAIAEATQWDVSGWPDFAMYAPLFMVHPEARIYGAAVPREQLGGLMENDVATVAGAEVAAQFGLTDALPPDQQTAREALQKAAHCDALPDEMLPMMVTVQRLRDAMLADAALAALEETGGPVIVITGNGHARKDWGAPFYITAAAPDIVVFSLGQGEAGQMPDGGFDLLMDGPAVDRGDPCEAFR